jgi:hypothetical protein
MSSGDSNLLARASRVRRSLLHHFIGFATAADYRLTTEQRNIISFDEFV